MKKLLMIITLVILLCFTFGCQQGEEVAKEVGVAPLSDEDVAAIKASTEAYVQARISSDWAALTAFYTEDAIVMPPDAPIAQGRDAIQTLFEASLPVTEGNLTAEEIDGRGDIAYVRGTGSFLVQPEGAPEPIRWTGKYIEIRRKQENGLWLIAIDIWNSDMSLPPLPKKE